MLTVLVTGASSGIGRAIVEGLANDRYKVHASARRTDRLAELAEATGCIPHTMDVRDVDAVQKLGKELEIDVVVNNAGLGLAMGSFAEASANDIDQTLDTNVSGALHVTRAFLPGMIARGRGHIVNVGSMAGLYPLPAALYGASKAALSFFSSNLRLELHGTGVKVTEICPGRVATEFYDREAHDPEGRAATLKSGVEELTPADIAAAILYAIEVPWRVNINRIELQPTEQTYGGSQFVPVQRTAEFP